MKAVWYRRPNLIISFGLMIMIGIAVSSYVSNKKLSVHNSLVVHTVGVLNQAKTTLSLFQDIETGTRGFALTGDPIFLDPYQNAVLKISPSVQRLELLASKSPPQSERIASLKVLKDLFLERTATSIEIRRTQGLKAVSDRMAQGIGKRMMDDIRTVIARIETEEQNLLAKEMASAEKYLSITSNARILGSLTAVGLILFALIIVNRQFNDLRSAEKVVHKLNNQLTEKIGALENSNYELESFSHSVSHDLRAPLRTMVGFSSIIIEDHGATLSDDVKENLNRVVVAAKKMGQLIDGLLDLSRLTRKELAAENVNLSEIAESILAEFRNETPERKCDLHVASGLSTRGDPRLLRAALYNLLSNAWKFTRGKQDTQIEFGKVKHGSKEVFFIRDNGAGFDMTYSNKLFGVFQRLHSEADYEGTGIGLATVQRIIQRHGGTIWAESAVDQGTTFYFNI